MKNKLESLYLHFPFCRHLCNYCDFYKKIPQKDDLNQFHSYLNSSWKAHQKWIEDLHYNWAPLKTFYIGGGTPSLWGEKGAQYLKKFFKSHNLTFLKNAECTMEVNPGTFKKKDIDAWKDFGINRFSIGIQSLNSKALPLLDRVHSIEESLNALDFFSSLNIPFSIDFMLGLPFSRKIKRDIISELEQVLQFSPSHISLYILTVKKNYSLYHGLPNDEWIVREYLDVAQYLTQKKYKHYEVSNFALPNHESVHNLRYWHSQTIAALGWSAVGFLKEAKIRYRWSRVNRFWNEEHLNAEELLLESLYLKLRLDQGIKISEFFFNEQKEAMKKLCESWHYRELATYSQDKIALNSNGFLVLDSLMEEIFNQVSKKNDGLTLTSTQSTSTSP